MRTSEYDRASSAQLKSGLDQNIKKDETCSERTFSSASYSCFILVLLSKYNKNIYLLTTLPVRKGKIVKAF